MALRDDIIKILLQSPKGVLAKEIAAALKLDTSPVNSALYSEPLVFERAADYRWRIRSAALAPAGSQPKPAPKPAPTPAPRAAPKPAVQPKTPANENAPPCPLCGGEMTTRTARKGPNAGGQFLGCKKYPDCKGVLQLDGKADSAAAPTSGTPTTGETPRAASRSSAASGTLQGRPRALLAASCSGSHRLTYVEGAAVPRTVVRRSVVALAEPLRRAMSQWRLDLPSDLSTGGGQMPGWLTVARALLRRGRLMPIADPLAERLRQLVDAPESFTDRDLQQAVSGIGDLARAAPPNPECFDSDEESAFYVDVLGAMVGPHARGWVLSQPLLGSLTGDPIDLASNQRVDFAVLHSRGLHAVVEIDGQQHDAQLEQDNERDQSLLRAGFEVVRIPAEEIRQRDGLALRSLLQRLRAIPSASPRDLTPLGRWLLLCKRAHQIQLAVLEWLAVVRPRLDGDARMTVRVELDAGTAAILGDPEGFVRLVLDDLASLVSDIALARGEPSNALSLVADAEGQVRLSFDSSPGTLADVGYIADAYAPVPIAASLPKGVGSRPAGVSEEGCERVLARLFGFSKFREGQFPAVARALNGLDSIVLLPTGSGKSVAFQLASLLRTGVCIVVDPILSLIDDQIDNLRAAGIDRVTQITGDLSGQQRTEILDLLKRGEFLFCYVAPERFQNEGFRNSLLTMTALTPVALVAIDEAHCVSEWGHDFRPAYLNLARNARHYCQSAIGVPPLMALTGTASHSVLKDVQRELGIAQYEAIITPATFDRPELSFEVFRCRSEEKMRRLHGILLGLADHFAHSHDQFFEAAGERTMAGLMFCPHKNGDHGVVDVASAVASLLQRPVPFYAGGEAPTGYGQSTWADQRKRTASEFKRNAFPLMACTKAFGMGIDKPNVRYTIHYNVPASIESFYQEAGRAGRDRKPARCVVLVANDNPQRSQRVLAPSTPIDEVRSVIDAVKRPASDDITRVLFFHVNSFRGTEEELSGIEATMEALGDMTESRSVVVGFGEETKTEEERALHRLLVLGVVRDYTVDYAGKEFKVSLAGATQEAVLDQFYRYLAAYQRQRASATIKRARAWLGRPHIDFVRALAMEMIAFVYEVVERGRRRNLSEMLQILEAAADGEDVRRGVLDYLQKSKVSQAINELPSLDAAGLPGVVEILGSIRSSIDAAEARGETARALGAYPDYPGLLLLRAAAEALTTHPDDNVITENARAAAQMAREKYEIPPEQVYDAVLRCVDMLFDERPASARLVLWGTLEGVSDRRDAARWMLAQRPDRLVSELAAVLIQELNGAVKAFLGR